MVPMPSHSPIVSPGVVASQETSTKGRTTKAITAELAPIEPTTVNGSQPSSSSRRCAFAMIAAWTLTGWNNW